MTKLESVAMIGALLLGTSALALAQTSSTTSPSSGTTTAPSDTTGTVTQPTTGSHPPMATPRTGATTGPTGNSTMGATTAPGPQSAMRSEQDVTKRLQAAGYSDVTDVKQDRNGYTAMAMKNGKRVRVGVDANGNIIQSMN